MTPESPNLAEKRKAAAMFSKKQAWAGADIVSFLPLVLKTVTDAQQDGRCICFTGLGEYTEEPH